MKKAAILQPHSLPSCPGPCRYRPGSQLRASWWKEVTDGSGCYLSIHPTGISVGQQMLPGIYVQPVLVRDCLLGTYHGCSPSLCTGWIRPHPQCSGTIPMPGSEAVCWEHIETRPSEELVRLLVLEDKARLSHTSKGDRMLQINSEKGPGLMSQ